MQTLESYLCGSWAGGEAPHRPLHNPTTGEQLAQVSSKGLDLNAAVQYARDVGGPALRAMSFTERGAMLDKAAKAINDHREELIELATLNGGNTRKDAKFDLDGCTGTMAYYARLGHKLGDTTFLVDGNSSRLSGNPRYIGQHISVTRPGVAVHINAFNFPAWGMGEKAAVSLLAGVPVISKPATSTALVAYRVMQILEESGVLPEGALQMLVGSTGDLLDHLGPHDAVAFTGSADTGAKIRGNANIVKNSVRVNIEADSLNSAVLGPDVEPGSDTWNLFLTEVVRDMTQKAGQKCTAIRRIFVPKDLLDDAQTDLVNDLEAIKTGNPTLRAVTVSALATQAQQEDIRAGIDRLLSEASTVHGGGNGDLTEVEGDGGFFVTPTLLKLEDAHSADAVHAFEVFGPVATLMPYDGSAADACALVARGQGSLVSSVYSDDKKFIRDAIFGLAAYNGRVHIGGKKIADHSPGPGTVMPQMIHGGPGRAGAGEELGGLRGLAFYMQRTGVQGNAPLLDKIFGEGAIL